MLDAVLFLGIKMDEELQRKLASINPHLRSTFIDNGSEYLHEVVDGGVSFLGKQLGKLVEVSSLELVEANIRSILHKLLSESPPQSLPLTLFATTQSSP